MRIEWGATNNTIGGLAASDRNIISGNANNGVEVIGQGVLRGTVAWWNAEGNADDAVGGHNGSMQGGTTFASGLAGGQAFSLDGVNDYVSIPDSADLTPPLAISVEAWVRPDSLAGSRTILSKYDSSDGGGGTSFNISWDLRSEGGRLQFGVYEGGDPARIVLSDAVVLTAGAWQHVAATFDVATQEIRIYLNGALVPASLLYDSIIADIQDSNTPVRIGAIVNSAGTTTNFWDGLIDEPAIYSRALDAAEIQAIHSLGGAAKGRNVIQGNYIGLNLAGTVDLANNVGVVLTGGAAGNLIGTDGNGVSDGTEGNVISGNTSQGVLVIDADNNRVAGNIIGLNATGTAAVPNFDGVFLQLSSGNIIGTDGSNDAFNAGERNVISGNLDRGVVLQGANVVAGNWIGLSLEGSTLGNQFGIQVTEAGGRVGTNSDGIADTEERNVVSGNLNTGIIVGGASTTGVVVAGNYIGLDSTGALARPNHIGISLSNDAHHNLIGGTSAVAGNVIGRNTASGVFISGAGTSNNAVFGNYIGTDARGMLSLGNLFGIVNGDSSNLIGGALPGQSNTIAFNTVGMRSSSVNNSRNVFYGNLQLAVDVPADGITLNDDPDTLDGQVGMPVITSAFLNPDRTVLTVMGFAPRPGVAVELYLTDTSVSGLGQGRTWVTTLVEGAAGAIPDHDTGTGSYGPTVNGITVATGSVAGASRFQFQIPLSSLPANVAQQIDLGKLVTGQAIVNSAALPSLVGPSGEFGNVAAVADGATAGGQLLAGTGARVFLPPAVSLPGTGVLSTTGYFIDSGSTSWTVLLDFGDGDFQVVSPSPRTSTEPTDETDLYGNAIRYEFPIEHIYEVAGDYNVTATVINSFQQSTSQSMAASVANAVPVLNLASLGSLPPVFVGDTVTLQRGVRDDNTGDQVRITVDWGDGTTSPNIIPVNGQFTATHVYSDNSNTAAGLHVYTVQIIAIDQSGAVSRLEEGRLTQVVYTNSGPNTPTNAPLPIPLVPAIELFIGPILVPPVTPLPAVPAVAAISPIAAPPAGLTAAVSLTAVFNEGIVVSPSIELSDGENSAGHMLVIDWGDGSATHTITVPAGTTHVPVALLPLHTYVNSSGANEERLLTIQAYDAAHPEDRITVPFTIRVAARRPDAGAVQPRPRCR